MSGKLPDFESLDFDSADIFKEDARIDSFEAKLDADKQQQQVAALQQQAVHEAVSQCLGACLAYLDTLYLQRDAEPCSEVALAHNSWQQEAEPEPCSRDAWLRGALPETVVSARTPGPPADIQAVAHSSAGKEQRARPGSGLLSQSRKGPALVASSAAADDAQHRPQSKAQQSRRTSIAQSVQSMKLTDGARPASGSRPNTNSSTALRPASGTAGNHSTPASAAAAAAADAGASSSPACVQAAGDDTSITAAGAAPAASGSPAAAAAASTTAAAAGAPVSTQRKQASKASKRTPDQQEAEERLRQELQLRRQQEAVVKELKQKDEAARAALLNMQKDLKGKDYTYDGKGKVVPLAKVNPEALPAPPGPHFKVQLNNSAAGSAADSTAGPGAAAAAGGAAAGKQAAGSTKSGAVAANSSSRRQSSGAAAASSGSSSSAAARTSSGKDAAGAASTFYVEQAGRTQPPVLLSIKPSAGVTLKVGGSAKQGPKRETSAQQQTRTQFQQQAQALNMQTAKAAAGAGLGALGSSSRHSNSRVSSAAGMQPGSSSAGGGSSSAGVSSVPGSARSGRGDSAGARASSAGRSTSGTAASGAAAEGLTGQAGSASAGPAGAGSVLQGASRAGAAGGAGVIKSGRGSAGDCSSGPDINLLLVNAPDWGVASGGGPCAVGQVVDVAKPSDRQLQEEFGRTTHLPKTRAPVATLKTPKTQPNSTSRLSQLA